MPEAGSVRALAVVPVYNHITTVRVVVEGLLAQGLPVLVVDDGSTEDVLESLRGLPVQTLRHSVNQGKGAALLLAGQWAREQGYEAIISVDADGQHHPEDAPRLWDVAQRQWPAVVIGRRNLDGPNVPRSSRYGRTFSNFWVRLESGRRLDDTQSGFRVYPVSLLAPERFLTRRYTFEVEVLVRAAWTGLPIVEQPISVTYQHGKARISHFRAGRDNFRLSLLHSFLLFRSLVPGGRGEKWCKSERQRLVAQARVAICNPVAFLKQLAQEHASPGELATAVWLGVFIGSMPIVPFGLATTLYVAHRLHLNKLAGTGGSNLCVAPLVPLLCIQIGHLMRHGRFWTEITWQNLFNEFGSRIWEWFLGALLVGPVLGLLAGLTVGVLLRWIRTSAK